MTEEDAKAVMGVWEEMVIPRLRDELKAEIAHRVAFEVQHELERRVTTLTVEAIQKIVKETVEIRVRIMP